MKRPVFTRDENLNCKLSNDDIAIIRRKSKLGVTAKKLAQQFNVNIRTIYYWRRSDEEYRKQQDKVNKRQRGKPHLQRIDHKSVRDRKMKLHPELVTWETETARKYLSNPLAKKKRNARLRLKYRTDPKYRARILERNHIQYRKRSTR